MIIDRGKYKFAIKRTEYGLGLFTLEPIPRGKKIIEYVGTLVSNEYVEQRVNGKYFFGVNSKWSIDGTPRSNIARYINHSCRPNCEAIITGRRVWIWTKRAINAGEELVYDYGKEYFDIHLRPKGCGCEKCRETKKKR